MTRTTAHTYVMLLKYENKRQYANQKDDTPH